MPEYSIRQFQRDAQISFRRAREAMTAARRAGRPIQSAEDALAWLANPPEDGPEFLARLHPDDPRAKERLAASVIREIELAVDRGERLWIEAVTARVASELAAFKAALLTLPSRLALQLEGATVEQVEALVAEELQGALSVLIADDPATWPDARLTAPSSMDDELSLEVEEDFEAEYLPALHRDDVRYRHHSALAELRAHEAHKIWSETISLRLACAGIKEEYRTVREHFASLPTRISFEIEDGDPSDTISRKIQTEIGLLLQELEKL